MDKKIITAAIVGAIVSFLLGWLIYGFLLMDYYTEYSVRYEGLMKDPPELWAYFATPFPNVDVLDHFEKIYANK